ncbi:MAG: hypothetical protein EAZ95_10955 [Bacteroidetes bacterium]|nr:MAG: hypothetical protein EAZ95_10955 [Bacteroidota bacterium]
MTIEQIYQDLQDLTPEEQSELGFSKFEASIRNNHTFVGGWVVFPIFVNVSYQSWENGSDLPAVIDVKFLDNTVIGHIYFSNNEQIVDSIDMSVPKMCAYLVDVDKAQLNISYKLSKDYLVIEEQFYEEYIEKYKKTSILWGGFYHEDDKVVEDAQKQVKTGITCLPNLELPTPFHQVTAQEAILHIYPFERFLKNYQLLELLFDYQTVEEIIKARALATDRNKYNKSVQILNNYDRNSKEVEKLQYVIAKNIKNLPNVILYINKAALFKDLAKEVFFEYGKESNPDKDAKFFQMGISNTFAENTFYKKNNNGKFVVKNGVNESDLQPNYDSFMKKMVSYWIYRIRCCIAHNKIGEFSLSPANIEHQEFMIKFAEPLLQEVLIQCFTK